MENIDRICIYKTHTWNGKEIIIGESYESGENNCNSFCVIPKDKFGDKINFENLNLKEICDLINSKEFLEC